MGTVMPKKKAKKTQDFIQWFEIPVLDIERAVKFYNHIYQIEMETYHNANHSLAYFPTNNGVSGSLVKGNGCIPTENGTLIYLNAGDDLNNVLLKVTDAGGRVVMEKTFINDDSGYFALFIDSEGNKLALHSKN